jgi:hypothetical protein
MLRTDDDPVGDRILKGRFSIALRKLRFPECRCMRPVFLHVSKNAPRIAAGDQSAGLVIEAGRRAGKP